MPAMRLFTCFLQLLAGLALPTVPPQQWALSAGNSSSEVEAPKDPLWGPALLRGADILSARALRVQASVGEDEARKEETQGQGEEEEREAETHRLPPVWQYCSPEVTSPSEERPHTRLVYLLPSHSQLPPCWHLPLFISQLYPC
ncbi:placenta growth factor isoform X9 [Camelus ferus]|uniref:Placenta growth factor isoform X9 n=2 Tax=Camelus TaxID=9836 RepID=A0A8B8T7W4_CAMFR|nr:placenta growth factor isoform X10 [Camelus dromedarius]XP_032338274.1 placenta growth factor isoform X9 [Camelus ferus]XP_045379026.1 placenta growth factor isoform X9 [Camelus bactrianus]